MKPSSSSPALPAAERIQTIEADITALRDGLAAAASYSFTFGEPQAVPVAAGHREASCKETVDFLATTLLVGIDDNGQPTYKAKGGQYAKFGVRIWPEVIGSIVPDITELKPGQNPVNLKLRALMGENGPRKIIGLAE
jgi:hypothetical protein